MSPAGAAVGVPLSEEEKQVSEEERQVSEEEGQVSE